MKMTSGNATGSSTYPHKVKGYSRWHGRGIALLSVAVFCVAPLPAWATRTVTLKKTNESSCAGTLQISGNGWGKKKNDITISAENSSTLPVEGVIAHATATAQKFKTSIHYSVVSPCSNDCSTASTVTITAKGSKGNIASNSIKLPGLYCGIIWAP